MFVPTTSAPASLTSVDAARSSPCRCVSRAGTVIVCVRRAAVAPGAERVGVPPIVCGVAAVSVVFEFWMNVQRERRRAGVGAERELGARRRAGEREVDRLGLQSRRSGRASGRPRRSRSARARGATGTRGRARRTCRTRRRVTWSRCACGRRSRRCASSGGGRASSVSAEAGSGVAVAVDGRAGEGDRVADRPVRPPSARRSSRVGGVADRDRHASSCRWRRRGRSRAGATVYVPGVV